MLTEKLSHVCSHWPLDHHGLVVNIIGSRCQVLGSSAATPKPSSRVNAILKIVWWRCTVTNNNGGGNRLRCDALMGLSKHSFDQKRNKNIFYTSWQWITNYSGEWRARILWINAYFCVTLKSKCWCSIDRANPSGGFSLICRANNGLKPKFEAASMP